MAKLSSGSRTGWGVSLSPQICIWMNPSLTHSSHPSHACDIFGVSLPGKFDSSSKGFLLVSHPFCPSWQEYEPGILFPKGGKGGNDSKIPPKLGFFPTLNKKGGKKDFFFLNPERRDHKLKMDETMVENPEMEKVSFAFGQRRFAFLLGLGKFCRDTTYTILRLRSVTMDFNGELEEIVRRNRILHCYYCCYFHNWSALMLNQVTYCSWDEKKRFMFALPMQRDAVKAPFAALLLCLHGRRHAEKKRQVNNVWPDW